jgi:hypothetical protein
MILSSNTGHADKKDVIHAQEHPIQLFFLE